MRIVPVILVALVVALPVASAALLEGTWLFRISGVAFVEEDAVLLLHEDGSGWTVLTENWFFGCREERWVTYGPYVAYTLVGPTFLRPGTCTIEEQGASVHARWADEGRVVTGRGTFT